MIEKKNSKLKTKKEVSKEIPKEIPKENNLEKLYAADTQEEITRFGNADEFPSSPDLFQEMSPLEIPQSQPKQKEVVKYKYMSLTPEILKKIKHEPTPTKKKDCVCNVTKALSVGGNDNILGKPFEFCPDCTYYRYLRDDEIVNMQLDSMPYPRCYCQEVCTIKKASTESNNPSRIYFTCLKNHTNSVTGKPKFCNYFMWVDVIQEAFEKKIQKSHRNQLLKKEKEMHVKKEEQK